MPTPEERIDRLEAWVAHLSDEVYLLRTALEASSTVLRSSMDRGTVFDATGLYSDADRPT